MTNKETNQEAEDKCVGPMYPHEFMYYGKRLDNNEEVFGFLKIHTYCCLFPVFTPQDSDKPLRGWDCFITTVEYDLPNIGVPEPKEKTYEVDFNTIRRYTDVTVERFKEPVHHLKFGDKVLCEFDNKTYTTSVALRGMTQFVLSNDEMKEEYFLSDDEMKEKYFKES